MAKKKSVKKISKKPSKLGKIKKKDVASGTPKKRKHRIPVGGVEKTKTTMNHPELGSVPMVVWTATFDDKKTNAPTRVEAMAWLTEQREAWRQQHGGDGKRKILRDRVLKNITRLKNVRPFCTELELNHLDASLKSLSSIVKSINPDGSKKK